MADATGRFRKGEKRPAGAGRKPGSPNKVNAQIRAAAALHGPAAIEELARIAHKSPDDRARIAACKELLDRGFGKPGQALEVTHAAAPAHELVGAFFETLTRRPE